MSANPMASVAQLLPPPPPVPPMPTGPATAQQIEIVNFGQAELPPSPSGDFNSALTDALDQVQQFSQTVPKSTGDSDDKVGSFKQVLLPSPYNLHPELVAQHDGGLTTHNQLGEGTKLIFKSFDHALTLALFSQVISGISSTTSSLIRQS